jgi:hypothetical protein
VSSGRGARSLGMSNGTLPLLLAAAALGAAAAPAAAQADQLLVAAPGAVNVASAGGYAAWAQPVAGGAEGFQLAFRAPDGKVTVHDGPAFAEAPVLDVGTDRLTGDKRVIAVFPRCEADGTDCDVRRVDLTTGEEGDVPGLATAAYSEKAVAVSGGAYVVVRSRGKRNGVFFKNANGLKQLATNQPYEIAYGGGRVSTLYRHEGATRLALHRPSGEGRALVRTGIPQDAVHLTANRYSAGFTSGATAFRTNRIGGSGPVATKLSLVEGSRGLPAGTTGVGADSSNELRYATTAEGLVQLSPRVRFVR